MEIKINKTSTFKDVKQINQWLFLVPVKGGRWHISSPLYTTYSPCLRLGAPYATDPTFYGNQKQPIESKPGLQVQIHPMST